MVDENGSDESVHFITRQTEAVNFSRWRWIAFTVFSVLLAYVVVVVTVDFVVAGYVAALLAFGLSFMSKTPLPRRAAAWVRSNLRKWRLRRTRKQLFRGTPIRIAEARQDTTVTIRGEVKSLGASPSRKHGDEQFGRFEVVDDTGVAVVDDDMLEYFSDQKNPILREGDMVEVFGSGALGAPTKQGSGFRGTSYAFEFYGTPESKVHVAKLKAGRTFKAQS